MRQSPRRKSLELERWILHLVRRASKPIVYIRALGLRAGIPTYIAFLWPNRDRLDRTFLTNVLAIEHTRRDTEAHANIIAG
jgi:hypothetical protein